MRSVMRDSRVATFHSPFMAGDVKVEYCDHSQMLVLKYRTKDGMMSSSYDVTKPREVTDMVFDAIALAAESVGKRV
nr:MAG TPA: hypothetical protein [Caudoviricetes sp.]